MLLPFSSTNDDNDSNIIDLLYNLCKENEIEKVRSLLPFIGNINIINKIQNSTGSTYLHVACYYGHRDMVQILLEYGALHSIRNLRHNLTPYEEAQTDDIKQLLLEQRKLFSNNDYDYIEWSIVGDDLLGKRREFREAIDLYKTYDNHHLVSKLLAEVIHYYLNEYLVNQSNDIDNPEDQITRKQIETIEAYFKEAIEKQDYLTYFIKAYTLTDFFYKVLNKNLALYILEYFDTTKTFSSNYRLVNCLVHIVTLLIYHPNLPQYQYQGICYRGMKITQNDLDQYQLNQHILNRAFLSSSTDRQVAMMFAGEGQQSQMRYTPKNHCALQYSCLCQYLIKQSSTAVNIQNLSMRPDEKEILIIPFTVFKRASMRSPPKMIGKLTIIILLLAIVIHFYYQSINVTYLDLRLIHSLLTITYTSIPDSNRPMLSAEYRAFESILRHSPRSEFDQMASSLDIAKQMRASFQFDVIVSHPAQCQVKKQIYEYEEQTVETYWIYHRSGNIN
ncbi:unnamed protein product [Rotaria sordida]|uniref:NAD(P)(+)--arginine ADP-ribosyltransferase n=3 Tax=Rotaria sordida TaxID=392033 RepID=A0A814GAB5_9BILA|nr:unnamed protein product [Rotaria sordida]